jgi:uncharacterized protein
MKLHLTQAAGNQLITGYEDNWIEVNGIRCDGNITVTPERTSTWDVAGFEQLDTASFDALLALKPEVVLLGTGKTHRFIHPKLIKRLTEAGIGVECMTTAAACRTYNILMAEGRSVAAALIIASSHA